jgi:threonine/homoserine/homoserine lactone efflux protein
MFQVCQDCRVDVLFAGALAGLALAIPLGPMAILLISTTLKYGRKIGFFGALAMATVDFSYAALVFAFGNVIISTLTDWLIPLRILGSLILVLVAFKIFRDALRSGKIENSELSNSSGSRAKTYAKFFGLTVINPATAFYFVGVTPSVATLAQDSAQASAVSGIALFAIGVFVGSFIWQISLVFAAQLTKAFTNEKIQHRIQYFGAGLILLLAIGLLLK